jgi:ligand-binding SRPBCC domain-containing protein
VPASFTLRTEAAVSVEALFDACLDVGLHVASMGGTRERAVAGTTSGRLGLGESVTWRAWHFGVCWRMTSRITVLERPHSFIDEQERGPFRLFRHEHRFASGPDGGTVMLDILTLATPVGGRLVERLVLVPYLRRLVRSRNAHLIAVLAERARTTLTDQT